MLANLVKIGLLIVRMFSASKAMEFIQFDVLSRNARDDFFVGSLGLNTVPITPSLYGGRMNVFNAPRLQATSLRALVEWRAEPSLPAF